MGRRDFLEMESQPTDIVVQWESSQPSFPTIHLLTPGAVGDGMEAIRGSDSPS